MTGATITEVGTPACDQPLERLQPPVGRARARLHGPGELAVERGHRQRHLHQAALGHRGEKIEIAQHQRRFGDDADRVIRRAQHFEDAPHDAVAPLDRLIGIGVGADGDGTHRIAGIGQLAGQSFGSVGLGEQLGLEVEPRRQAEKGMGRPGEAVDAAMLAAPIGVDRTVEADIGGFVAGDDAPRRHLLHFGGERIEFAERVPAIVDRLIGDRLEPAGAVGLGTPAMPATGGDAPRFEREAFRIDGFSQGDGHTAYIVTRLEQSKNMFMVIAM